MNDGERQWMAVGRKIADRFQQHREYREQALDPLVLRREEMEQSERDQLRFEIALWLCAGERICEASDRWRDRK